MDAALTSLALVNEALTIKTKKKQYLTYKQQNYHLLVPYCHSTIAARSIEKDTSKRSPLIVEEQVQ